MTTGQKIAECRKKKNLTQQNLAGVLGVSRQAVSRWESDLAFPETDHLTKMSKLFGVSADYLLNYGNGNSVDGEENGERWDGINLWGSLKNFHIEYKSKRCIGNLPLLHINIGLGRTAKGIFAVGLKSAGIFSAGLLSVGVVSAGVLSIGAFAAGALALGLISAGSLAVGVIALGAVTLGIFALGAVNFGLFSVGAVSFGYFAAIGDRAYGGIALGASSANGRIISVTIERFAEMKEEIYMRFNEIPSAFSLFTEWTRGIFDGVLNGVIKLGG